MPIQKTIEPNVSLYTVAEIINFAIKYKTLIPKDLFGKI